MIEYRPFRNTDTPQLAEVWRAQPKQRGLMQPMSVAVFERYVLSRPYFDPQGLIVAAEGGKLLGFAHAGFGPSADESTLSTDCGVTSIVMLRPETDMAVASALLARTEAYLTERGARTLFGGGCYPLAPFYYGLYGGGEFSGVLDSDVRLSAIFREHGYTAGNRWVVMHRDLAHFQPVVDRQQMQIRRHTTLEMVVDPPTTTWWEACIFEPFDRTLCYLLPRTGGEPSAKVHFWNMETMTGAWGVLAVGVKGVEVGTDRRRNGLATYLLGEAFRHLHAQGVTLAEVHVAEENVAAQALFRHLGFEQVDQAVTYCKDRCSVST